MNLLLITVDDMSCDSVGVYGSKLEGTTPVMDRLASQSLRFEHAHAHRRKLQPLPERDVFLVSFPTTTRLRVFTRCPIRVGIWWIC